ncbi:hypothetical protein [Alkalilimnicola sp. S0819]|uniref:hypothetical protein n=1 Tax=Alkalilimnicola sp. S0819 TaxID=2613922 RepID=UPI00126227FB|nr:hypothetical protein [Alkalilimnicola sp. S0819]KAB7624328.1 hypothetical protein F3N43_05840 [Alkalilimnicola sp. S0819]MPQ16153.1 hypothetical protein [Alkalilimnicola sp. S0819]
MPLTADRHTPYMNGELVSMALAAGAEVFAGALVVANATGYVAPGSTATGLTYLGRAEEHVDNSAGADGDEQVLVRRRQAFRFSNSDSDPVGQSLLGKRCYIVDDETVAGTDGTGTRSEAGVVIGVDDDGVWVE